MSSTLINNDGQRARNLSLAVAATMAALYGGNAQAEDWQWAATPYIWATDVGIDLTVAGRGLVDADIPFEELLEQLDGAALVRVEGMRGQHGMAFDLFNVELVDAHAGPLPRESGATLALDTAIGMTILDVTGVYDARGDGQGFSVIYGARVIEQRNEIAASLSRDGQNVGAGSIDTTDRLVDGLVGFRYVRDLPGNFSYQFAADVSTGDTELTWSAGPTVGYTFGERDRYQVMAGYRHMDVDFDTAEAVDADLSMSGLMVGFRIQF